MEAFTEFIIVDHLIVSSYLETFSMQHLQVAFKAVVHNLRQHSFTKPVFRAKMSTYPKGLPNPIVSRPDRLGPVGPTRSHAPTLAKHKRIHVFLLEDLACFAR